MQVRVDLRSWSPFLTLVIAYMRSYKNCNDANEKKAIANTMVREMVIHGDAACVPSEAIPWIWY